MLSWLFYLHLVTLSYGITLEGSNIIVGDSNITITITLKIETQSDQVDITMSGPSDRWFGFGFGNTVMDQTYVIVGVEEEYVDVVIERILGDHNTGPGWATIDNQPILSVHNDDTTDAIRHITMQRNRNGYYTFPNIATDIDIIWAFSSFGSKTLGFHGYTPNTYDNNFIITLIETGTSHPTVVPTAEPTTPHPTEPTRPPTTSQPTPAPTHEYNVCDDTFCPYVAGIVYMFSYSYGNDDHDWNDVKALIASVTKQILLEWIPDILNIEASADLSFTYGPQMLIRTTIGIENNDVYIALRNAFEYAEIWDNIESTLPTSINERYKDYEFSIQALTESYWDSINGTYTTTTTVGPETTAKHKELYSFIFFDFAHYTLYDFVVFIGCIVLIVGLCVCCCWCCRRMQDDTLPESMIRAKTGVTRLSINFKREIKKEKPQTELFKYPSAKNRIASVSPDDKEDAPVIQAYKPGYQASPMEMEFKKALGAAANDHVNYKMNIVPARGYEQDNRDMGRSIGAMSTVSFGAASLDVPQHNPYVPQQNAYVPEQNAYGNRYLEEKAAPGHYDDEPGYYEYNQEEEHQGMMGPPRVSGSMVDRMNQGNESSALHADPGGRGHQGARGHRGHRGRRGRRGHRGRRGRRGRRGHRGAPPRAPARDAPPPTVTGSMVDRMNRGNALY